MKSFLKYMLATIVGVLITGLLFFLISMGIIGAMVSKKQKPVDIKANSVLHMELNHAILDRSPKSPFSNFNFMGLQPEKTMGLNDILANIEKAKKDDEIEGIYMDLSGIPAGMATIEEIRKALLDFKDSNKFVISYSDNFTQTSYYLASVSDYVYMNPEGRLNLTGLSSEILFFKETLDKLGVEPQIIRHGKFKSAIEPFTKNKMSPENREQVKAYMGSLWNKMDGGISEARSIEEDEINKIVNELTLKTSKAAVDNGFIDELKYKDQILEQLKDSSGLEKDDHKVRFVSLGKYAKVPKKDNKMGLGKDKIAVVYAMGSVIMGEGEEGTIGSDRISRAIRKARKDTTVKAIVFRVNSGGGSALASEVIWREVVLAQKEKPVIASLGDVAASGGYYIVSPADKIVASPNTITGSIGVFGLFFNVQDMMNNKLGIHVDAVKTHEFSNMGTPFRPMTAKEREVIQLSIEDTYDTFITHVAEGRDMKKSEVDEIGQGRVWSGEDAKRIGLVDEFGGLRESIEMAAKEAGLEEYRTVELPKLVDPFQKLMKDITGQAKMSIIKETLGNEYRYYQELKNVTNMQGIQARIPYAIEVY